MLLHTWMYHITVIAPHAVKSCRRKGGVMVAKPQIGGKTGCFSKYALYMRGRSNTASANMPYMGWEKDTNSAKTFFIWAEKEKVSDTASCINGKKKRKV